MPQRDAFTLVERPAMSKRGFTLVELLVVVAIIVALLAILLPSMAGAIAAGQRAACGSNLRQVGNAFLAYAADRRGMLPSTGNNVEAPTGSASAVLYHWLRSAADPLRERYLGGSAEVLACPTWIEAHWDMDAEDPRFRKVRYMATTTTRLDPATSGALLRDADGDGQPDNFMMRRLTDPAARLLLGDHLIESSPGIWNWGLGGGPPPHPGRDGDPGGGNGGYLDGHVQWRDLAQMHNNYSYSGGLGDGVRDYYW